MKKIFSHIPFLFFMSGHAVALVTTTSISPIVFLPFYKSVGVSEEFIFHPKNTARVAINYSDKSCGDCSNSGHAFGKDAGVFYRYYFASGTQPSWLGEIGMSYLSGRAREDLTGRSSERSAWEGSFAGGRRFFLSERFFGDLLGGGIFRTSEIKAGKYIGYRKSTPVISFYIGMKFE